MITKRRFLSLACAGSVASVLPGLPFAVRAQAGHNPARMLVGFTPGGAIDTVARMLVEGMKNYSPSFIVDNRPGAGGRVALGALKASPNDGSVMILAPATNFVLSPHIYKKLDYDAFRDFIPVSTVCTFSFLLTVGPMVPADVRTLADFVQWCKANPGLASYGTAAAGSVLHFTGVSLARAAGFEFVHLPYAGPSGIQDLIGGRIAATIYPTGTALPHVQAGAVRALAMTGPRRSPLLPDVPTVREAGYPNLEGVEWFGVFVPANTPLQTVNQINDAIGAVVKSDAFRAGLGKLSIEATSTAPGELAQLMKSDFERWGPTVRASGFTPDD